MSKTSKTVVVKQDEENLIQVEVLADSIVRLDVAMQKVLNSGLTREAIVVLLRDLTKVRKEVVSAVLDGLRDLRKTYCTK